MTAPRVWKLGALAGLAVLVGCSGGTGPAAGTLTVTLSSPHADDGGLLLTISGGPVDSIEAPGHAVYSARPDANTLRLILSGQLASGAIARLHIPDTRQASSYRAELSQVAARSSYVQRDPGPYTVSLLP